MTHEVIGPRAVVIHLINAFVTCRTMMRAKYLLCSTLPTLNSPLLLSPNIILHIIITHLFFLLPPISTITPLDLIIRVFELTSSPKMFPFNKAWINPFWRELVAPVCHCEQKEGWDAENEEIKITAIFKSQVKPPISQKHQNNGANLPHIL